MRKGEDRLRGEEEEEEEEEEEDGGGGGGSCEICGKYFKAGPKAPIFDAVKL